MATKATAKRRRAQGRKPQRKGPTSAAQKRRKNVAASRRANTVAPQSPVTVDGSTPRAPGLQPEPTLILEESTNPPDSPLTPLPMSLAALPSRMIFPPDTGPSHAYPSPANNSVSNTGPTMSSAPMPPSWGTSPLFDTKPPSERTYLDMTNVANLLGFTRFLRQNNALPDFNNSAPGAFTNPVYGANLVPNAEFSTFPPPVFPDNNVLSTQNYREVAPAPPIDPAPASAPSASTYIPSAKSLLEIFADDNNTFTSNSLEEALTTPTASAPPLQSPVSPSVDVLKLNPNEFGEYLTSTGFTSLPERSEASLMNLAALFDFDFAQYADGESPFSLPSSGDPTPGGSSSAQAPPLSGLARTFSTLDMGSGMEFNLKSTSQA
ncbi:hypothetical protein CVT26_005952 [Gymnopilus dilepis]|uniref:Uncharacterized protein n=1 Tax=Gymnopilus dilepis TaxID=231916 RepID=A0A409WFF4_9AGAR|nr:hypothetical protein CVT26_005952 [Gymnopilus dilepis]